MDGDKHMAKRTPESPAPKTRKSPTALFPFLDRAIAEHTVIRIAYESHYPDLRERTVRDIEPYRREGEYCDAFCRLRQEFRTFRLDRIREAELTGEIFQPRRLPLSRILGPAKRAALLRIMRRSWVLWILIGFALALEQFFASDPLRIVAADHTSPRLVAERPEPVRRPAEAALRNSAY